MVEFAAPFGEMKNRYDAAFRDEWPRFGSRLCLHQTPGLPPDRIGQVYIFGVVLANFILISHHENSVTQNRISLIIIKKGASDPASQPAIHP
jgi:hypothetical protein